MYSHQPFFVTPCIKPKQFIYQVFKMKINSLLGVVMRKDYVMNTRLNEKRLELVYDYSLPRHCFDFEGTNNKGNLLLTYHPTSSLSDM